MGLVHHMLKRLDPWLYRTPFEGRSARRYAALERPGFGEYDERLIDRLRQELGSARRVLDVGAGPGTFSRAVARSFPELSCVALEPSGSFSRRPGGGVLDVRARAEAMPFETGSFDVAVCLSSIRHVQNRVEALRELRRVIAPGGVAIVVELDPDAPAARVRNHARSLGSPALRWAFGPLVVRTAPSWRVIAELARGAGWRYCEKEVDPEQPVYQLRLSGPEAHDA